MRTFVWRSKNNSVVVVFLHTTGCELELGLKSVLKVFPCLKISDL